MLYFLFYLATTLITSYPTESDNKVKLIQPCKLFILYLNTCFHQSCKKDHAVTVTKLETKFEMYPCREREREREQGKLHLQTKYKRHPYQRKYERYFAGSGLSVQSKNKKP